MGNFLTNFISRIGGLASNIRVNDIIDIIIVALVLYKLFMLIRETRAEQLTKGIFAIVIFTGVSEYLELYTINWILKQIMTVGALAILIMFQPELRRALEHLGRSRFLTKGFITMGESEVEKVVDEFVIAVSSLSRQKIGALIVFERSTGLNEIIETGTYLNAQVSSGLIINIFIPNTPLHDGAMIVRGDKIMAAGCFLPLTDNQSLSRSLGTRHRAALGISERSDALTVVVSEETGAISIAENGKISRYLDNKTLKQVLINMYGPDEPKEKFFTKWRRDNEERDE